jgi:hypothetical protein
MPPVESLDAVRAALLREFSGVTVEDTTAANFFATAMGGLADERFPLGRREGMNSTRHMGMTLNFEMIYGNRPRELEAIYGNRELNPPTEKEETPSYDGPRPSIWERLKEGAI